MEKYVYKLIFLGESGTGAKTNLISQLIGNGFNESSLTTNIPSYATKFIQTDFGIISLELWDTVGQEKFRSLQNIFIKGSHCVILGYDITNKYTFNEIKNYHYDKVKNILSDEPLIYLVANKIDLIGEEQVTEEEAINFANKIGIKYFRVFAKTRAGIDELLEDITNSLIKKFNLKMDNNHKNLKLTIIEKYYNY